MFLTAYFSSKLDFSIFLEGISKRLNAFFVSIFWGKICPAKIFKMSFLSSIWIYIVISCWLEELLKIPLIVTPLLLMN